MPLDSDDKIEGRLQLLDQLVNSAGEHGNHGYREKFHDSLVSRDGLLDTLTVLYEECCCDGLMRNRHVSAFVKKYRETISKIKSLRIKVSDFEVKDVIGRGHFGEVQVVRDRHTETVYALKILRKNETLQQSEISFYDEERDIMAHTSSPWITKLHYAFQDATNLYLVMEFHAGGDLLSLLARHDDIFEEKMARFYLAEIVLAAHDLHKMGYVHRDIKPENILLDCSGHVKLADFGSAAKLSEDMLVSSKMPVGTPDYVSPELLTSMNSDLIVNNYGLEVDWWSLGVCLYEMLYGKTPFTDDAGSMVATYSNIMNFKKCLKFPNATAVSTDARSLIEQLLTDKEKRLSYPEIKKHRFFKLIYWDSMRQETPPFVPQLSGLDDTSNFEEFEKIKHSPSFDDPKGSRDFSGKDLPFVGFTYSKPQAIERLPYTGSAGTDVRPHIEIETVNHKQRQSSSTVDVTLTVKIAELTRLREKCNQLENSECQLKAQVDQMKRKCSDQEDSLTQATLESEAYQRDLENYIAKTNRLSKQLEAMAEEKNSVEAKAERMLSEITDMSEEAKQIEGDLFKLQIDELQEVITQLQEEKAALMRKVSQKDRQVETYRDQLASSQKHAADLQARIDKERRKSRNDQKRDLVLLETREDIWKTQIEDKNTEIMELTNRITELEEAMEAYDSQEKEYMEREQALREKMKHRDSSGREHLEVQVLLRTSSSPRKEVRFSEKLKELETSLEMSDTEKQAWIQKEEELKDTIEKLKTELENQKQRGRLTSKTLDSLTGQVQQYQQEIQEQRQSFKNLQENVRMCMTENDEEKTNYRERSLERKIRDLEEKVDGFRDDKRRLLSEVNKFQQEANDKHYRISELERTNTRLQCKNERIERHLADSRRREIDLRLKRHQTSDIRVKLAEERVKDVEEEKLILKSRLEKAQKDLTDMKDQRSEISDKSRQENLISERENRELKVKMEDLNKNIEKLELELGKLERNVSNQQDELNLKQSEIQSLRYVKLDNNSLDRKVKDLERQLHDREKELKREEEKSRELPRLRREKENLETKVGCLEKELSEARAKRKESVPFRKASNLEDVEDLKQEKRFMESRLASVQRQLEQAEGRVVDLERKVRTSGMDSERLRLVTQELEQVKKDNLLLEERVKDADLDAVKKLKSQVDENRRIRELEDKLEKDRKLQAENRGKLHEELEKSNLALSEARSLLSATQRQEKSTRELLEAEIRELQLRVHKLEKEKGNVVDEKSINDALKKSMAAELEKESKVLKSQNESLSRKNKELEGKLSGLQREKSAGFMEKQLLKDSLAQKEHECELETQKVEKLRIICGELEDQIKDLEGLQADYESREAEWNTARHTFEKAVEEREQDLEGTTNRISALNQARQTANEKIQTVKQQLHLAKEQHKTDIETLQAQMWEGKKESHKALAKVAELENQTSKLQLVAEQQKSALDVERQEKMKLREEVSKVLTENQDLRKNNIKLRQNLEVAVDKFELIFGEKIDLENFTEALKGLHFLEKYRFESTIGQQMKLIDYLKALWEDSVAKKKKGGKMFGGKQKEATSPVIPPQLSEFQSVLEQEKKRNDKLQEQVDRLRAETVQQANELLKVRSTLRERQAMDPGSMTPKIKAEVQVLIQSSSGHTEAINLLTPSIKRASRMLPPPTPTPQRMQHNIPHRFVNGLNTRATKCGVCLGSVHFVKQAAKCQECSMVCHLKCVSSAAATCGLPNEYVRQFGSMMDQLSEQLPSNACMSPGPEDDVIKMKGWLKIPKNGKQGWERRWVILENNILMLFNNDCDANPVDSFNLCPPETDVTVHSAVSTAELPSTASTDLPYVLRLEHEPLTTCWPGRVLYLLAPDFSAKQKWVACLEAGIKSLQKGDRTKRGKMKVTKLLELTGDKRLELNCALLLSKQLTLLGADEGLYATNVHRDIPVVTRLNDFEAIHQIRYIPELTLIVLVAGKNRNVLTIDKKLIQLRLGQCNGEQTSPVPHTVVENSSGCTVVDVGVWQDAVYMCIGMTNKIILMKYNPDLRLFCVRKEFYVSEPCSCVCVAEHFVLVGTDKFYQINLEHPSLTEFVDKRDNSLAFAAFGAAIHNSYPLAVIRVSPIGLPLEFLLCFHEFGVFVDSKGRRSRPADVKWSCLPLSFAYREPFLYVTYFNSMQAITIPASKEQTRGKQTSLDLHGPRYLGSALKPGSVLIASSTGVCTEVLGVRGNDGTNLEPYRGNDKENRGAKTPSQRAFASPRKVITPAPAKKPTTHKRRLSLTSVDSNSSVSSSSTVSSYGSKKSLQSDV